MHDFMHEVGPGSGSHDGSRRNPATMSLFIPPLAHEPNDKRVPSCHKNRMAVGVRSPVRGRRGAGQQRLAAPNGNHLCKGLTGTRSKNRIEK